MAAVVLDVISSRVPPCLDAGLSEPFFRGATQQQNRTEQEEQIVAHIAKLTRITASLTNEWMGWEGETGGLFGAWVAEIAKDDEEVRDSDKAVSVEVRRARIGA